MKKRFLTALAACVGLMAAWPALAGSVSGRLLDPSGKPVAGAAVKWIAYRTDDQILLDQTSGTEPATLGETKTGEDGRFRVALDKPGLAVALRIFPAGLPSIRLGGPYDSTEDSSLDDLHVAPAAPLTGRVVDDQGKPVAGAAVSALASDPFSDVDAQYFGEGKSGTDGAFSLANAPAAPRAILVRVPGYVPATQLQLEPRLDQRITVKRGGTIQGIVTDASGKPAAGALVVSDDLAVLTDATGAYRLAGVDTGLRAVEALWKDDFASRKDAVRVQRGAEAAVSLKLARAATIAGSVLDETTRKPVAGVRVGASSGGFFFGGRRQRLERSTRTDAQGKFRLTGLAPRAYTVSASREGFLASSISGVTAGTSSPGSANLALAKAASIAGKVVDEKGAAMPGARVRIERDGGMRGMLRRGPAAFLGGQNALSGPDGAFRIRNLAAGRNLLLEAEKSGYTTGRRAGVTIKTGEAVANLSLVLKKGIEARGKVQDAQGKPVANAEIRVALRDPGQGMGGQIRMVMRGMSNERPDTTSGPDGTFLLRGLEEGEYSATVSRDGYGRKVAQGLPVKAGSENVWPPITIPNGVALAGTVKDSSGKGIPGAQLFAIALGEGFRPQEATTDLEGRFRVDGLAPDKQIFLNVTAEGYGGAQRSATPPAEDLAIVLKTAGTVRGRVEDGDTKQPITDFTVSRAGGRGGAGAGFAINIANGRGNGDRSFQAQDGTFELPDVPPGKWTLRASAAGYRTGETSGVDVGEGETKEGLVISLRKGGSLSGRVLDPARGTGIPNASVSWRSAGDGGGAAMAFLGRMGGGGNSSTTTDADGKFRFDGLPTGHVTVTADHTDYLEASRDADPDKDASVDITLGTGGAISGSVVGRDGRSPVAGALVSLDAEGDANMFGGGDTTRTDGSGTFSFDHLQAGRFKLTAQSAAGKSAPKEVVLADNQRQDGVLIGMNAAGARIVGTVSGLPSGKLGGVRVGANSTDFNDAVQTDDSGNFTFQDVPAGVVRFNATTNFLAGRSATKTAEVPEGGGDVAVQIVFEGTSRLSGRVTRGSQPLSGLFVAANADPPQANGGRATGQTDENGRYALEGLSDGNYQVNVNGQGVSYHKVIPVSGDTAGDIAIPAVTLSGTVIEDATGQPIEGAVVQAETGKETATFAMKSASTDSSGNFQIDGIDPGNYQVTARKSGYQLKTQSASVGSDAAQLNFALTKGSGLTIRVADGLTGLPMHGVTVLAFGASGTVAYQGQVALDSTGTGEISSLTPGAYSIYLFSDGYAPRSLPSVTVPAPTASVAMTPGGRVEIRSAAAATGQIADGSGSVYLMSPFRLDGRVSVFPPVWSSDHFAPGNYRLMVGSKAYPFTVAEGQTTRVDVN